MSDFSVGNGIYAWNNTLYYLNMPQGGKKLTYIKWGWKGKIGRV